MYGMGKRVTKDYNRTFGLFNLAADQGYARGQDQLGFMYRHGKGVRQAYVGQEDIRATPDVNLDSKFVSMESGNRGRRG